MDLETLFQDGTKGFITLEATVDTGFESVALDECKEVLGLETPVVTNRGRIFFVINKNNFQKVHSLRSVDNLYLVSAIVRPTSLDFSSQTDKESDLEIVKNLPNILDWKTPLDIWKDCVEFSGVLFPTKEEHDKSLETKLELLGKLDMEVLTDRISVTKLLNSSSNVLRFRVTCNRSGKHSFTSMEAARDFGGRLHDLFHWVVDLTSYNIDVVFNISNNKAYVGLGITRQSKHIRNISHFGPTTLRATVCYNMLRLASPKPGEIVIDPLCGGGSIPIEGALAYPSTYQISGDFHEKAVNRCRCNIECLRKENPLLVDVLQWNATNLPLKTASVDVFVTDLPFGKRSGHKKDNRVLYKEVLLELGRVVQPATGRAVLITHDRRTFIRVLPQTLGLWKQTKVLGVNLGGLNAGVFQLMRTCKLFTQ